MSSLRSFPPVKPAAGDHAIVEVAFGFEWDEPLAQEQFELLSLFHKIVKGDLPRKREVRADIDISVLAGEASEATPHGSQTLAVVMDAVNTDGSVARQIEILDKRIVYKSYKNYRGWNAERHDAMRLLDVFLKIIARERGISALAVQFIDAFLTDSIEGAQNSVFNVDSELLPRHIFHRSDLWHVHQGYFEADDAAASYRRLTNLNSHIRGDVDGFRIEIQAMHRAIFRQAISDISGVDLTEILKRLHEDNIVMLKEVLSGPMLNAIGIKNDREVANG